jgi:hypothetical protein
LRARLRPYFFDSFSRGSRVSRPFLRSVAERLVHLEQRAGDAVAHGAGLAGDAAARAFTLTSKREPVSVTSSGWRTICCKTAREVIVDRLLVDRDDALTEDDLDAGDGALAAAGAAERFDVKIH